ncbi:uncharacterized protein TNCV_2761661 [Trichonephila clavipes]|nr:uncharacterized protein TNCV_2761661 [Trichonephila clavipes]
MLPSSVKFLCRHFVVRLLTFYAELSCCFGEWAGGFELPSYGSVGSSYALSHNAGVEGLSNISKYPGHLPAVACYDGNPLSQGLVGVDGACLNKTLHMVPEEGV